MPMGGYRGMSLAILRLTQVDGQETTTVQDPYIQAGFYSDGPLGTPAYKNEPIHVIAVPRKSRYPLMRWMLLEASRLHIGAILHTERFTVMIADGQLADAKLVGPTGGEIFFVTINVQSALNVAGGGSWYLLQRSGVTTEPDDEGIVDDLENLRGRKLAGRAAKWVWDKYSPF